ncbi:MAG: DUF6273 domain-containing protein [Lachnospiraceae bacterium]|nr:DUF6273 domain-containing protein [Lachnospiraceae bacterium]
MLRKTKPILRLLTLLFLILALIPFTPLKSVDAASVAAPKISVKLVEDGTGIKVTIGKTKKAEGHEVNIFYCGLEDLYTEYEIDYSLNTLIPVFMDGSKKRSFVVYSLDPMNTKTLAPGHYEIKVRSYRREKGKTVYSEFCNAKTLSIKDNSTMSLNDSYNFFNVKIGDIVNFGSYEQDTDFFNGKEDIEWIVLSKTNSEVCLITKDVIEYLPWDPGDNVKWEDCKLRKWLNGSFYDNAFNKKEKSMIKTTTISNRENSKYATDSGYSTDDKVFILSEQDMINGDYGYEKSYDTASLKRRSTPSQYVVSKGAWQSGFLTEYGEKSTGYWLRTLGDGILDAEYVNQYGAVDLHGTRTFTYFGVRPVIVLNV